MSIARNEGGFALLIVLLVAVVIGGLSMAGIAMVGNATLINVYAEKQTRMEDAASSGLELARALVNGDPDLHPESGFTVLDPESLPLVDASGAPIPGLTRTVYIGPSGVVTGQYGVFGSIVSVVEDEAGNRVVYHGEVVQESFSKFAYFTDRESLPNGTPIYFGPSDQLFGPVHSNDVIRIYSQRPIFHGPVTTHEHVQNPGWATFRAGRQQGVARIELPDVADLGRLQGFAETGSAAIVGDGGGGAGEATTRVEFIAIDINGDGDVTDANEGFFKIYQSNDAEWVVAGVPSSGLRDSPNCGHRHPPDNFYSAPQHDDDSYGLEANGNGVLLGNVGGEAPRCYLGGSDSLAIDLQFRADDGRGEWLTYTGGWAVAMPAAISARADRDYLFPLGAMYNPEFKGVIHVTGKAAISGVVRGRVTLATTGAIIIADDIAYASDPGGATCNDILGLFAGGSIIVADNSINAPVAPQGNAYRTYDNTSSEIIHAVLLTLGSFTVENYDDGSVRDERCEGDQVGRGCLYVTGGIIQARRGPVGLASGTGYLKRYSYDQCAYTDPPPYFPTTGHFVRGRVFQIDPTGFDVDEFFARITAG